MAVTLYVPTTGDAQLTTPLVLTAIPAGAPLRLYVTGLAAVTTTENDKAVPAFALIVPPVTTGAVAAAIVMLYTALPLKPVFVSVAVTVTA